MGAAIVVVLSARKKSGDGNEKDWWQMIFHSIILGFFLYFKTQISKLMLKISLESSKKINCQYFI